MNNIQVLKCSAIHCTELDNDYQQDYINSNFWSVVQKLTSHISPTLAVKDNITLLKIVLYEPLIFVQLWVNDSFFDNSDTSLWNKFKLRENVSFSFLPLNLNLILTYIRIQRQNIPSHLVSQVWYAEPDTPQTCRRSSCHKTQNSV
jgi:hypothetical protein